MVFSFFEISFLVPDIFKFLFLKLMANRLSTKINHKIKNISGNIGVMLLKLGIIIIIINKIF